MSDAVGLTREAFFQAWRKRGCPEDEIHHAFDDFHKLIEPPGSPGTQRVRRFRTKEAMLEPVPEGTVTHKEQKPAANAKSKPASRTKAK
jgi:hypothetical protein